jgi:hypothetical protein
MKRTGYLISFTAIGGTHFPLDMLRYDSCWPADTDSALSCALTQRDAGTVEQFLKVREIHLFAFKQTTKDFAKPTIGRWNSFGWGVKDIRIIP